MPDLELRFLGECSAHIHGEPVALARKELHVLAYLALHSKRGISRETLAARLWPETGEERARYNLRRALSNLRRALGEQQRRILSPTLQTLAIDLENGGFCDVVAFDDAASSSEMVHLYAGPLLPDCYDDWVLPERDRRDDAYKIALARTGRGRKTRHLPIPLTGLIGRGHSLETVRGYVDRVRLVTLLGPGGAGKTRLALAVGEAVEESFADGARFVDLATLAVTDDDHGAGAVLRAIIKALPIAENAIDGVDALARRLADSSLLIVFDNCEHVLREAGQVVDALLSRCPDIKILATSRQALGLAGEQVFPVPSLALPADGFDSGADADAFLDFSAIRLFVERATQANPRFQLTRENAGDLVAICRRLDGMPLGIEMAASRARTHDVSELAAQLARRLDLLEVRNRVVTPRQQTLGAAIAWSYDLLADDEKALFRAVSVFYGGFPSGAADALLPGSSALLPSLVEKSLIVYDVDARRYGLLQTLQQFGAGLREAAGETDALQRAHLEFFCRFCEESHPRQVGPGAAGEFDRIEREHDNLRAACAFGVGSPDPSAHRLALKLAASLDRYFPARGAYGEGRQWFESVLTLPGARDYSPERARCLNMAGMMAFLNGDFTTAETCYDRCLSLAHAHADDVNVLATLINLANLASEREEFAATLAFYRDALGLARGLGVVTPRILSNLASCHMDVGEPREALVLLDEAVALARAQGDPGAMLYPLNVRTELFLANGDTAAAAPLAREIVDLSRKLGNNIFLAIGWNQLGMCAIADGDLVLARACREEGLAIADRVGWEGQRASTIAAIAEIDRQEGDFERAARLWGAVVAMRERIGTPLVEKLQDLAALRDALGDDIYQRLVEEGARLSVRDAIALARRG